MADDIKVGDRVKYEGDGTVVRLPDGCVQENVHIKVYGLPNQPHVWVPLSACTRIKPEFEWRETTDSNGNKMWKLMGDTGPRLAEVYPILANDKKYYVATVFADVGQILPVSRGGYEAPETAREFCEARLRERKAAKPCA